MKTNNCTNCGSRMGAGNECGYCGTVYVPEVVNTPVNVSLDIQRMEVQVQQARMATEYMALDQKSKNLTTAIEKTKAELKSRGRAMWTLLFITFGIMVAVNAEFAGGVFVPFLLIGGVLIFASKSPMRKVLRQQESELKVTKQRLAQLNY